MIQRDIQGLLDEYGNDLVIVHGGCPTGADKIAHDLCRQLNIREEVFPAQWDTFGKAAGPKRNAFMVSQGADLVLAYPKGVSRGTRHCMSVARKAGIEVIDNEC